MDSLIKMNYEDDITFKLNIRHYFYLLVALLFLVETGKTNNMIMFSELLAIEFFNHRAIRLHHKIIFLFYFVNKCFKGNPFGMLEQDNNFCKKKLLMMSRCHF